MWIFHAPIYLYLEELEEGEFPLTRCVVLSFILSKLWHTISNVDGSISTGVDVANHILSTFCEWFVIYFAPRVSMKVLINWINDPKRIPGASEMYES